MRRSRWRHYSRSRPGLVALSCCRDHAPPPRSSRRPSSRHPPSSRRVTSPRAQRPASRCYSSSTRPVMSEPISHRDRSWTVSPHGQRSQIQSASPASALGARRPRASRACRRSAASPFRFAACAASPLPRAPALIVTPSASYCPTSLRVALCQEATSGGCRAGLAASGGGRTRPRPRLDVWDLRSS